MWNLHQASFCHHKVCAGPFSHQSQVEAKWSLIYPKARLIFIQGVREGPLADNRFLSSLSRSTFYTLHCIIIDRTLYITKCKNSILSGHGISLRKHLFTQARAIKITAYNIQQTHDITHCTTLIFHAILYGPHCSFLRNL